MSWPLLMDHHVPAAVTLGLRARGVTVVTAADAQLADEDDEVLLMYATQQRQVLFSQDRDLLAIGASWQAAGREFMAIVLCPQR